MKRPKRYLLTYVWTIPCDIIMWIVVLLIRLIFGGSLHWCEGLWCEVKRGSFLAKEFFVKWAGVTLGHGGLYGPGHAGGPGIDTKVERHEHRHVEQYEASMLASFTMAIAAFIFGAEWYACAAIWVLGGSWVYGASVAQAWIRGEDPYRGSYLEEAAYAQD